MDSLTEKIARFKKENQERKNQLGMHDSRSLREHACRTIDDLIGEIEGLQCILRDCTDESMAYQAGFQHGLDYCFQSEEVKKIAREIGFFYLDKWESEGRYLLAAEQIQRLKIRNIFIREGKVCIVTARPGLLIGVRGENIDNLSQWLKREIKIIEAKDDLEEYLIPQREEEEVE